jgi:hypothetical protein
MNETIPAIIDAARSTIVTVDRQAARAHRRPVELGTRLPARTSIGLG